jgi:mannose-6-phosphate isomerase
VFDWNRVGLDGKPRELHVPQSLASIDFEDFEPGLVSSPFIGVGDARIRHLADDPLFKVDAHHLESGASISFKPSRMKIVGVVEGTAVVTDGDESAELQAGHFCLIPAAVKSAKLLARPGAGLLFISAGK